mgnify:CR=1 FL=1
MDGAKRVFTQLFFWLICLAVVLPLLPGPPAALQRSWSQPELEWQWVQPLDSGGLRLSACFGGPVEVRLVLQDQRERPYLATPYYRAEARYFYIISVALPQLDSAQTYQYHWEVKGDTAWAATGRLYPGRQPLFTPKPPTSKPVAFASKPNLVPFGLL